MTDELRTVAEMCLEDYPPDPNAVELATLVLAYLDARPDDCSDLPPETFSDLPEETQAGIRRGIADIEAGRYTTVPPGGLNRIAGGTARPSARAREAIARVTKRRERNYAEGANARSSKRPPDLVE